MGPVPLWQHSPWNPNPPHPSAPQLCPGLGQSQKTSVEGSGSPISSHSPTPTGGRHRDRVAQRRVEALLLLFLAP